jgi:hypothetical protein
MGKMFEDLKVALAEADDLMCGKATSAQARIARDRC